MALASGTKLGPYIIESAAGAGGMGEVYKATDSRLDRTVAVKVLALQMSGNQDLRLRFEREAKAISSLNHPNICTLYDVGHQEGIDFLVMEYLEGETLATRLAKGPLGVPEMLTIATQIADALDKAHRAGLIHRDLKPGNIMLTKSGAKLLDFGLAKLQDSGGVMRDLSGITRTTTPLTGEGAIVGTLQYMAPEQLEGKEVDARTDIFAFGAILYEMATGRRAFEGGSQASLIASIIKEQPRPISELQPLSPPMLERVIRQCLEKDPDQRWNTAGDLKRSLLWITEGGSQVGVPLQISVRRKSRERILWAATGVLGLAALAMGMYIFLQPKPEVRVAKFVLPQEKKFSSMTWPIISPDGKLIAFQAQDSSRVTRIWIRPLNSLEAYPLSGTDNVRRPFWSPDSKHLAFFDRDGHLKRIAASGGPAQLICDAPRGADGSWGKTGTILFDGNYVDSIRAVPAAGGAVTQASYIDHETGETGNAYPSFLPDGKHFLYIALTDSSSATFRWRLMLGELGSEKSRRLTDVSSRAVYASPGYILYVSDNTLVAHPFDADALEFTGDPVPLANDVSVTEELAVFSVSDEGQLVYERGSTGSVRSIAWYDRTGVLVDEVLPPGNYDNVALSPNGKFMAYELITGGRLDIWVHDLQRDVSSRLTFHQAMDAWPVWSRDGSTIYFSSNRVTGGLGRWSIYRRAANGMGDDIPLKGTENLQMLTQSACPDSASLIVMTGIESGADVGRLNLATGEVEPLLATSFVEKCGSISPNGRFLLYQSNESSRPEVYVRELSATGGKWQVSTSTGRMPAWRDDGNEIFYVTTEDEFMAVSVSYTDGLQLGAPQKLFTKHFPFSLVNTLSPYKVSPDGQRFLIVSNEGAHSTSDFIIMQNWAEELKGR